MQSAVTRRARLGRIAMRAALVVSTCVALSARAADVNSRAARLGADGSAYFETRISLDRISPAELHLDTPSMNLGKWGGVIDTLAVSRPIVRELPGVWQLALDDVLDAADLEVTYEVESDGGEIGRLSHASQSKSVLRVSVESATTSTETIAGSERPVLTGSIRIFLYLDDVRHAGRYEGTLRARVQRL